MKKIFYLAVSALILLPLSSCKKGENDPFLSLRSRDARITGEWELVEAEYTESDTWNGDSDTWKAVIKDGVITYFENGIQEGSEVYTEKITIEKGGTYSKDVNYGGDIEGMTGYWHWLDTDKKKSQINLKSDYGFFELWKIDRLTNKEMVLKVEMGESSTWGGSTEKYTITGEFKYEKKK